MSRLCLPSFFIPEVADAWKAAGIPVVYYRDDPSRLEPDWASLEPFAGDFVLAVNYFGVRTGAGWRAWHQDHRSVILVEDHTHDPLSRWALGSQANFALATLYKTFPAPDGAILWSPQGHALPPELSVGDWTGSMLKLAGMLWKTDYLSQLEKDSTVRAAFRGFQSEGDKRFKEKADRSVSPWSRALLEKGFPQQWRRLRETNVRIFLDLFQASLGSKQIVQPLFHDWPSGHCPLNPVLVFCSPQLRERCRSELIARGVFTPVHWVQGSDAEGRTRDLSARILTIPLDHRCRSDDLGWVVDCIRAAIG